MFDLIAVYCVCRKPRRRGMIGCDYCEEWFHPDCLQLSMDDAMALTDTKWKCPVCEGKVTIVGDSNLAVNEKKTETCDKLESNLDVTSGLEKCTTKDIRENETKRTKVNVGPGEWLWLVGDQLIPPTQEELLSERYETTVYIFSLFYVLILSIRDMDFIDGTII